MKFKKVFLERKKTYFSLALPDRKKYSKNLTDDTSVGCKTEMILNYNN